MHSRPLLIILYLLFIPIVHNVTSTLIVEEVSGVVKIDAEFLLRLFTILFCDKNSSRDNGLHILAENHVVFFVEN